MYHAEGRCVLNAGLWRYEYFLKDHLGNTRVRFQADSTAVLFREESHYYPFGMLMEGNTNTAVNTNDYKYNGKELNTDLGLNLSDYGARWYDAALGRWWSVDPLAILEFSHSVYAYVTNNPLIFTDPSGMTKSFDWDGLNASIADYNEGIRKDDQAYWDWFDRTTVRAKGSISGIGDGFIEMYGLVMYHKDVNSIEDALRIGPKVHYLGESLLLGNSNKTISVDKDGFATSTVWLNEIIVSHSKNDQAILIKMDNALTAFGTGSDANIALFTLSASLAGVYKDISEKLKPLGKVSGIIGLLGLTVSYMQYEVNENWGTKFKTLLDGALVATGFVVEGLAAGWALPIGIGLAAIDATLEYSGLKEAAADKFIQWEGDVYLRALKRSQKVDLSKVRINNH